MNKEILEKYINELVSTGADFADIFYEKTTIKNYNFIDSKLDKIDNQILNGVGIRISYDGKIYYLSTDDLSEVNLNESIVKLKNMVNDKCKFDYIKLDNKIDKKLIITNSNKEYLNELKLELMKKIDKLARSYDKRVDQVQVLIYEYDQDVNIGNSLGKYVDTNRSLTRLFVYINTKEDDKKAYSLFSIASSNGYNEILESDLEKLINETCESAINKLYAKPCPGGVMPVVVGGGFGVLIHEAVGHSLEATTVAKGVSILSNKLNKKVASDIVTIVDDGTIENSWGSILVDDEGNETRKNICIENGILTGYLIDELNSRKMNMNITGSGRREDYRYIPTSRMTNTYLKPGNDKIEDMIKSIDYGLYAKTMGGGSVDAITGDFNFAVNEAYLIRDGKIAEMVKGASLIGNTAHIMTNIEMISDDFVLVAGICGSDSGNIPVTCGEPSLKLSSILVGGESND